MTLLAFVRRNFKKLIVVTVPIVLLPLPVVIQSQIGRCAYGLILMAVFWITEAVPLAITALLPIVMFPLMGINSLREISSVYYNNITFVLIGGLSVAIAVEKWKIHRRFALRLLLLMGSEAKWLLLGFMLITAFLSMWMSNTATTSMMIPIAQAVLMQLIKTKELQSMAEREEEKAPMVDVQVNNVVVDAEANHVSKDVTVENEPHFEGKRNDKDVFDYESLSDADKKLCKAFCVSICYAANCGGVATLTGTGPNLVMKGMADSLSNGESGITFATWFIFGLPIAIVNMFVCWFMIQIVFFGIRYLVCSKKDPHYASGVQKVLRVEYDKLGPMSFAEKAVLGHFVLLVLLWFTLEPEFVPGWGHLFRKGFIGDGVPAIFICISLFVFPSRWGHGTDESVEETPPLLDWHTLNSKMPWGVCLLLGGGFALAKACTTSGLSAWLANQMTVFKDISPWVMIFSICLIVSFSTEVTSNTAICTIFMPILAELAYGIHVHPVYIMLPAAVASSFAFMLPVATPPNTIAFSYGYLRVLDMAKVGFIINIICVVVVTLAINTYGYAYFDLGNLPKWAMQLSTDDPSTVFNTTMLPSDTNTVNYSTL